MPQEGNESVEELRRGGEVGLGEDKSDEMDESVLDVCRTGCLVFWVERRMRAFVQATPFSAAPRYSLAISSKRVSCT